MRNKTVCKCVSRRDTQYKYIYQKNRREQRLHLHHPQPRRNLVVLKICKQSASPKQKRRLKKTIRDIHPVRFPTIIIANAFSYVKYSEIKIIYVFRPFYGDTAQKKEKRAEFLPVVFPISRRSIVFSLDLEIRLRMSTNGTNLRSLFTYHDMTAVCALPYTVAVS